DAIVNGLICQTKRESSPAIIEWLLQQGADPQQKFSSSNTTSSIMLWKRSDTEGSKTKVTVPYAGHSSISFILAWLKALQESSLDWSSAQRYLEEVMSLFAQNPAQEFVKLHPSFLDQWEAVLEMTDTHNVTFETADGEVTAHDHILMATSPVLKAMLQSTMKEGSNKRVQIKDSPSAGASRLLESGLLGLLSVDSFAAIAEAAALKGLERLQRSCASFGTKSTEVQEMLKKGSLPSVVCKLLGQHTDVSLEQQLVILLDLGQNIILNFIVATLAAMSAVQASHSLHTSMIRISTQWMTACSVITHFSIDQLPVFSWTEENLQLQSSCFGEDNCDETVQTFTYPWPQQAAGQGRG
ncbi:unnamed protein product, partial [Symbiodinium sp. KB8]